MELRGPSSKHLVDLLSFSESVPVTPRSEPRPPLNPRQFRFTVQQRQAVVAAYEAGQTMASLARQYGVKRETISHLLRRSGVEIRQRRVISQAEVDEAVRLYRNGLSLVAIGKQLRWDPKTIHRQLKKRGAVMRGPNDWQQRSN